MPISLRRRILDVCFLAFAGWVLFWTMAGGPPISRVAANYVNEQIKLQHVEGEYMAAEAKALKGVTDPGKRSAIIDGLRPLKEKVDAQRIQFRAVQKALQEG